jgi:predicted metalloprotease
MVRWRQGQRSANIEDRRGAGGGGIPGGNGIPIGRGIPGGRAGGIVGIIFLIIVVLAIVIGGDFGQIIQGTGGPSGQSSSLTQEQEDQLADFISLVLGDTEVTWREIFEDDLHRTYDYPTLVLFTNYVDSACGQASSAVGPFYCSGDQTVYLDLEFFSDLQQRYGAPGDFAQAYVVSHEVGHHVQNLLGTVNYVDAQRTGSSQEEENQLSVALELQADCYAGLWANRAVRRGDLILESGDVEEGLNAASAIGDDRLQQQSQGYVVPDTFTHGTSAQRVEWFRKGLDTGDLDACDSTLLPDIA